MGDDALDALRAAGHPIEMLSPAQLDVLRSLTPVEVQTLISIRTRLEAAGDDDVMGHAHGAGIF